MNCPKCDAEDVGVTDSRPAPDNSIRRRRRCTACGHRFTTFEAPREFAEVFEDMSSQLGHLFRAAQKLEFEDLRLLGDIARRMGRSAETQFPVSDISAGISDINHDQRT